MSCSVIGALRHRVVIERLVRTSDEGGTATLTWSALAIVFARIEANSGREIEVADGVAGRVTHKVLMRHRSDVLPEMRIVAGTRILEIRAALDRDGRGRWLECLCEERLP